MSCILLSHSLLDFVCLSGIVEGNAGNTVLTAVLSLALVALIVIAPITVVCSVALCVLAKDRAKFKRQVEAKCTIYEEIDIKRQSLSHVDITENVAYATCISGTV